MGDGGLFPGELVIGARLGGYRLDGLLGRGGMAVVYRAHDIRLDRRVAVKVLASHLARDKSFRRRFIRESRAAAAVDHPNIIPVFEADEVAGVLFIAMRFVDGPDVHTIIREQGILSPERACDMTAQVAEALDAAHARGLVHRDVKPANMLRDAAAGRSHGEHIYLSDFGLSKQSLSASGITAQGQFLGTPDYVSPEQITGGAIDGRADQYGLACSVFEMLTGAPPFRQAETLATVWAHLSAPPPALTSRRPGLPKALDHVLGQALAKAPADRYRNCLDFAEALQAACGSRPATAAPTPTEPALSRPARPQPTGPSRGPLMPGAGVARRPLHLIVLADCSGSMKGEKMQALNHALRAMLPPLTGWERDQVTARVLVRIIKFATTAQWHVADPTPAAELATRWRDLECVPQGRTNMGNAFQLASQVLRPPALERRALRPALLLITDGRPTDPPGGFDEGLTRLASAPAGRSALRLAVAIGQDANSQPLEAFRSPGAPVLVAETVDQITDRLIVASIAVSQMPEMGVM